MVWRTFLIAKIHGIRLTDKSLHYQGSITLGQELVDAAGLSASEGVQVVNITTGARLFTYVIVSNERGACVLNGAAARLAEVGDELIIMSYAQSTEPTNPKIVLVGANNQIVEIRG